MTRWTSIASLRKLCCFAVVSLLWAPVATAAEDQTPHIVIIVGEGAYAREEKALPSPPPLDAPAGATVLFDGTDLSQWTHWDPSVTPRAILIDRRAVLTEQQVKLIADGKDPGVGEPVLHWKPEPATTDSSEGPPVVTGPIRLQPDTSRVRFANIWVRPVD